MQDEPFPFQYELSAFLSASRSVLQYALKEARSKAKGQAWYDNHISSNKTLGFFKDKRDLNVHAQPLQPSKKVSVVVSDEVRLSESVLVVLKRTDGTVETQESPQEPSSTTRSTTHSRTTIQYFFRDWTGTEDVIELSKQYLHALQHLVDDGIRRGLLSG
jgi:hypothetical protein